MGQTSADPDAIPCGLLRVSTASVILHSNRTLERWLGYATGELVGEPLERIFPPAARLYYLTSLRPLMDHNQWANEVYLQLRDREGHDLPVMVNGVPREHGSTPGYELAIMTMHKRHVIEEQLVETRRTAEQAVREQERACAELEQARAELFEKQRQLLTLNEKLEQMAATDALTGLPNRRAFNQAMEQQLALWRRKRIPVSLILIDVDFFKRINDTFGHATGDEVLRTVAQALGRNIREADLAARVGGEEFTVLMPDTTLSEATRLGERLRATIETLPDAPCPVTISLGVTEVATGDTVSSLFAGADHALYQAKESGRNRVHQARTDTGKGR